MIKETQELNGKTEASITFIGDGNPTKEKNAWWQENELVVLDNLPSLLSRNLAHPMGNGKKMAMKAYPKLQLKPNKSWQRQNLK